MSDNSALKALLGRLGPVRAAPPGRSSSDPGIILILHRTGAMNRRIDVMQRLRGEQLSMRAAHGVMARLVDDGWAVCSFPEQADIGALARDLRALDVEVRRRQAVGGVDLVATRQRHGLSQRQFADLLGFDVRTLQNWEQGRNRPDPAALSLIALFDRAPEVIEELISEPIMP